MAFRVGDAVRVVDREATAADAKSRLFYDHFRGLEGTVERIYEDSTVCVNVALDSLPSDIRERHAQISAEMRDKWIDNLSQEAKSRLTEREKQFQLSYKIVLAASDLIPLKGKPTRVASQSAPVPASEPQQAETPSRGGRTARTKRTEVEEKPRARKAASEPKRPTLSDLEKAELKYLELKKRSAKDKKSG